MGAACLRTDAVYCAVAALLLGVFAAPAGGVLGVPTMLLAAAALVTFGWAVLLAVLASRPRLRGAVGFVMAVNVVAVAGLSVLALTRPLDAMSLLVAAVAVEVGAFAVWQGILLRGTRLS